MIGVGVIGYGYWGPNLVRNFAACEDCTLVAVADKSEERLAAAQLSYPSVKAVARHEELLTDSEVDAVVIATPVSTHFSLAQAAFEAGKHVLVEKPMCGSSDEARQLIDLADTRNLVLMVDHTFVYTSAVRKMRELVVSGDVGDIYYYDSVRVNLGLFQHDVNVLWDLAVHDLSILDYVLGQPATAVTATGMSHVQGQPENIAYMTLNFDGSLIGHVHANWLAPVKIRQTLLGGSKKMIIYDDLEPSEKIKIYDKGITLNDSGDVHQMLVGYRTGDMFAPQLPTTEALSMEVDHFIECINLSSTPLTDGHAGLRVVEILEAATTSMASSGKLVELAK